jgi:hypothetical protein
MEKQNHLQLEKPFSRGANWVMPATLHLKSGDSIRIEAEISPQTAARARAVGMMGYQNMHRWLSKHVSLPPEWQGMGVMAKAAAGVAYKTAEHPLLNLPTIQENKDDRAHPAFKDAYQMLSSDGYGAFSKLRAICMQPGASAKYRELLAGACNLGNCCCGMKHTVSCYDTSFLLDHPWAAPHHDIAMHCTDLQALRSYRSIWGESL